MGNLINRDGQLFHEASPGNFEQIALDEAGKPIVGILHGESADVLLDGDRLILRAGGSVISFPATVGSELMTALAVHVPDARAVEVATQLTMEVARFEKDREAERVRLEALTSANLAEKQAQIDAKQAELDVIKAKLDDVKGAASAESPALPISP